MIIVADASPLISLALIEELELLPKLFEDVQIPHGVFKELTQPGKPYSGILLKFAKNRKRSVKNKLAVLLLSHELDQGESEAIVLALENNIENILIDESKGRKIARSKGLHPIGTLGILIQAKNIGLLNSIREHLDKLRQSNVYISDELYYYALKLVNEF